MAFKWDGFTFGVMGLATETLARLDGVSPVCLAADSVAQKLDISDIFHDGCLHSIQSDGHFAANWKNLTMAGWALYPAEEEQREAV